MDASDTHLRPPHPRRPPANRSVSLKQTPFNQLQRGGTSLDVSTSSDLAERQSSSPPTSLKPHVGKDDSGESSNADKWFEKSNNDVTQRSSAVVDNDPPFFLQHSSSEETSPQQKPGPITLDSNQSPELRPGFADLPTDGSSNDDFRSVIDDLTIENKKLKRRLKKYEQLRGSQLKDEELFEVRVHGLSATKKRELEDLLQKFAIGLGPRPDLPATSNPDNVNVPSDLKHRRSELSSSLANDSAYASASASGQGSSGSVTGHRSHFRPSAKSRHQNVQSYLHHIPEGLLPRQPAAMSEKTKKKLVVRRLEQIFAGKGATAGAHHHPIQQQEVSQLAAKADATATDALGKRPRGEGKRESKIMAESHEDKVQKDVGRVDDDITACRTSQDPSKSAYPDAPEKSPDGSTPEQRPTRPLDLDPQRAQVPSENFQYMRHLGFSPPEDEEPPQEGHGWIYLNLLINMAQLHTINVTPEFVQKAISEYSTKFELSHDGRKVRWRGGSGLTRMSSDAGSSSPAGFAVSPEMSPRKRAKTAHTGVHGSPRRHMAKQNQQVAGQSGLPYTPIFFHRSSEDTDISSSAEEPMLNSPLIGGVPAGTSSGMNSSGARTGSDPNAVSSRRNKKWDNGPIIFYSNARFCTDLSGDNKNEAAMLYNPVLYHIATKYPVGSNETGNAGDSIADLKGPLNDAVELPEPMDIDDNPIPPTMEVDFPPQTPITSDSEKSPLEMQVSGIGGVVPADNFAINVQTQHSRMDKTAPETVRQQLPDRYPHRLAQILRKGESTRSSRSAFHKEVLSTRQRSLPPSELPPASCFMDVDSELDDDDELDGTSNIMMTAASPAGTIAPTAPQPINMLSWSDEESDDEDEDDVDDDESDGSLDLLANAREADPEAIRARELEYDAAIAERLSEEIPTGSSAATAGGGSGFASPASNADPKEVKEAMAAHRLRHG